MTRPILDPKLAQQGNWRTERFRVLPADRREFGHVPDAALLVVGDILLFGGDDWRASKIRNTQARAGFHDDHACWVHAALYLGDGMIVEATPLFGVRVVGLASTDCNSRLLVRRIGEDANLSEVDLYRVAIGALRQLDRRYSLKALWRLAWTAARNKVGQPDTRTKDADTVICSTLIRRAFQAVGKEIVPNAPDTAWPADLSRTPAFDDVAIGWVKIAP